MSQQLRASADTLDVLTVAPASDERWAALLANGNAGLFHSAPWLSALVDAYGFELRALVAVDGLGVPLAGLVFCLLDDVLGRRVVSAPFSDASDPLLNSRDAWPMLFAELRKHEAPVQFRCLYEEAVREDPLLTITKRARWHTLPIALDASLIRAGFEGSRRRALRKAEQSGVTIRPLEGWEGVAAFHRLHVALRKRKYRLLAQPLAFFEALRRRFGAIDGWFPLGAFLGERLIAATVYLRWGDTLYYKYNASSPDALEMRPNDLLVSAGVTLAKTLGCGKLDLGPSDDDQPGLIRFKRQFGGLERELRFLSYLPAGWHNRHAAEIRGLLSDTTRLFTAPEVPDEVTARAGDLLYRRFA